MRSAQPSCSAAAPGSRQWPSSPAARRRRESAWGTLEQSSRAIEAPPRARRRLSARRASQSRKPPTKSSGCSGDSDAYFCREGGTSGPDALFGGARGAVVVARLHADLFLAPGGSSDRPPVSVLLLHPTSLSVFRRDAFVFVYVAGGYCRFRFALFPLLPPPL